MVSKDLLKNEKRIKINLGCIYSYWGRLGVVWEIVECKSRVTGIYELSNQITHIMSWCVQTRTAEVTTQ
jgi:hypothetical protein